MRLFRPSKGDALPFGVSAFLWIGSLFLNAQVPETSPASGSGAAVVASTNSMEVLDNSRQLGAGDRISYRVVEERRPPISLVVTDSGELEVPLIGRVSASGKTCRELAQSIKAPLEREYFYKATVIIGLDFASGKSRGRVYLSGQVRNQGAIEMPPDVEFTLSKAVLAAGGLADFANARKVRIIRKRDRGEPETITVDLEEITKKGRLDKDPVLKPDDVVIVSEKYVNF